MDVYVNPRHIHTLENCFTQKEDNIQFVPQTLSGGAKQKKKKRSTKKSPRKKYSGKPYRPERGCSRQSTKKYTSRKSPPYPANLCCNQFRLGNDKKVYRSRRNKNGICTWKSLRRK